MRGTKVECEKKIKMREREREREREIIAYQGKD
jgi:hypothetical protein